MSKKLLFGLVLLASPAIYAEEFLPPSDTEDSPPSPLQSEVEFGYQAHTGNTDSQSLNARVAAEYTEGRHRTSGEWKYYQLYKNGDEDKNQQNYIVQTDYKLGPKAYLYGNYNGFSSLYSSYYEDHTVSGGLGYQLANRDDFLFEVEIGPGFRYQEPNLEEIDDKDIIFKNVVKEAIIRGNINLIWKPLDSLTFGTKLTTTSGKSNTRFDTELNVTNAITETIALKLSYDSQYHSKVPSPTLSKRDSIFTVNLLFSF